MFQLYKMEQEQPKLSYYQRNKETILAKRKLQREMMRNEGRPFMKFDDEVEIVPVIEQPTIERSKSVDDLTEQLIEKKVTKKATKKNVEPMDESTIGKKKTKKRLSV